MLIIGLNAAGEVCKTSAFFSEEMLWMRFLQNLAFHSELSSDRSRLHQTLGRNNRESNVKSFLYRIHPKRMLTLILVFVFHWNLEKSFDYFSDFKDVYCWSLRSAVCFGWAELHFLCLSVLPVWVWTGSELIISSAVRALVLLVLLADPLHRFFIYNHVFSLDAKLWWSMPSIQSLRKPDWTKVLHMKRKNVQK